MKPKPKQNQLETREEVQARQRKTPPGGARPHAGRKSNVIRQLESDLWSKRQHVVEHAIDELDRLTRDESASVRLEACKTVLDRVFGKARQHMSVDTTVDGARATLDVKLVVLQNQHAAPALPPAKDQAP